MHVYVDTVHLLLYSQFSTILKDHKGVEIAVGHRKYPTQILKLPVALRQKL